MDHTIAAIATAPGEGGIGIIRISGYDSFDILKKIFRFKSGKKLFDIEPRKMVYGNIVDILSNQTLNLTENDASPHKNKENAKKTMENSYNIIDECMAVYMKAPHTYTGEE